MAKYTFTHDGYTYDIEADDDSAAMDKFKKSIEFNQKQSTENYNKNQQDILNEGKSKVQEVRKNNGSMWEQIKAGVPSILKYGTNVIDENVPGAKTFKNIVSPSLIKGVPVARHAVPQTEELTNFETKHPLISTGLQMAGGTGAMLPLAAGAATASGAGFIPQMAGQLAVNGPANILDVLAKKGNNATNDDLAKASAWSLAESAIPAAFTKFFGQSGRVHLPWEETADFMRVGGSKFPSGANRPFPMDSGNFGVPNTNIPNSVIGGMSPERIRALLGLTGAAAGYGLHDMPGAVAGLLAGPAVGHALEPFGHTLANAARHPTTQDILRALMSQGQVQSHSE